MKVVQPLTQYQNDLKQHILNDDKLYNKAMLTATKAEEDELTKNILHLLFQGAPKSAPTPTTLAWGTETSTSLFRSSQHLEPPATTVVTKTDHQPDTVSGLTNDNDSVQSEQSRQYMDNIRDRFEINGQRTYVADPKLRVLISNIFGAETAIKNSLQKGTHDTSMSDDLESIYHEIVQVESERAAERHSIPKSKNITVLTVVDEDDEDELTADGTNQNMDEWSDVPKSAEEKYANPTTTTRSSSPQKREKNATTNDYAPKQSHGSPDQAKRLKSKLLDPTKTC